jgi:hypothetical protein
MPTGLERIAAKARQEPTLRFTSLAHHLDAERLWQNLCHVPPHTAPGPDGQTVDDVKQDFLPGSAATLRAVHTQGYRPPPVRRTYIPKPGKRERRPLGVPCVDDRVLQRSVADVLSPSTSRIFCRAPSVVAQAWGRIMRWQPSMK